MLMFLKVPFLFFIKTITYDRMGNLLNEPFRLENSKMINQSINQRGFYYQLISLFHWRSESDLDWGFCHRASQDIRAINLLVWRHGICVQRMPPHVAVIASLFQQTLHTTHHSLSVSEPYQHPELCLPQIGEEFPSLPEGTSIILHP